MLKCWNCHTILKDDARFCTQCGSPQRLGVEAKTLTKELKQELQQLFLAQFKQGITELFGRKRYKSYLKRLEETDFVNSSTAALSKIFSQSKLLEPPQSELFVNAQLDRLIYQFVINHCADLNDYKLSSRILAYFNANLEHTNLLQMFFDFMDFPNEKALTVYSDINKIPANKLKNATKAFLKTETEERILCLVDISIFGNCKEGFAITDRSFYWRDLLSKAKSIDYQDLNIIQKTEDWLTINGHFFNVKQSVNGKMLLFLKTVNWMHS